VNKGHGRLEQRAIRVSAALAGYSAFPGLAQVAQVTTQSTRLATGETSRRVRYLVTSLTPAQASPQRVLSLSRGHWGIENRLFHVKDDSFGEDRHVLQSHAAGNLMSLFRATALNLLRGEAVLWTTKTPLTARAEWVNGHPAVILAALDRL
jgi:Transposase DDE domain